MRQARQPGVADTGPGGPWPQSGRREHHAFLLGICMSGMWRQARVRRVGPTDHQAGFFHAGRGAGRPWGRAGSSPRRWQGCPRAGGPAVWKLRARMAGQQEALASRPMIVTPGLLPGGAAWYSSPARLAATGHDQPYPHTARRPGSESCDTAVRPPPQSVL